MTQTEERLVAETPREVKCGTGDTLTEAFARVERSIERQGIRFRRHLVLMVFLIVGLNKALDFLIG